jgi:site-specific DNA recombinase
MPVAGLYCRISREDQSTYSLSTQLDACRRLAVERGYEIGDQTTYIDGGHSSETLNRPALDRLRDAVQAGTVKAVIAYSPDRLSRDVGLMYLLEMEFKRHQVVVLYVTMPNDATPEGELLKHMRHAISSYELAVIRERTKRGKRGSALAGLPLVGNAALGFTYVKKGQRIPGTERISAGELIIDPVEADIVKEIFTMRRQGLGAWRIATLLTKRGVKTKRGGREWSTQMVLNVL